MGIAARSFAVSVVLLVPLLAASSARGDVRINEVESDGAVDFVELVNTSAAPASISGFTIRDNNDANGFTFPPGTMIAANGFYLVNALGFGLGGDDSARLFNAGNALVDSFSWTDHAISTYGRCPDGTGAMSWTNAPTPNAANACPAPASPWPGDPGFALADGANVFGGNLSGLAYQPSGSTAPGVLWGVNNGPGRLFRMVSSGGIWAPDAGWAAGKQLRYPNGGGDPDAEGATLADGDPNGIYVATERDGGGTSRPAVLRFDTSSMSPTLTATRDWNLSADLPGLPGNGGLEAIAWVPDADLVAKGFLDEATGALYNPAAYPNHGTGLFFVGVEETGAIIAYALNQAADAFTRVATIASGFPAVMALEYEPERKLLWALCDNSCDGRTATLDVAMGRFAVTNTFARPDGTPNLNNEGFAIAPQAECVNARKPVIWTDDGNTDSHALRTGTIGCTPPAQPTPTPTPTPAPPPQVDSTAPSLRLSLRVARTGRFAVRRTGRFRVTLTLGEQASLTITATARKNARAKARRLVRTTRRDVAAGRRSYTLKLSRRVRTKLRRGETLTVTIVARDAAGNATTRRVSAKVK